MPNLLNFFLDFYMAFPKLFILFFKIYLPKFLLLLGYIIFISMWQTNWSENIIIKFTISLLISLYCTALSPSKSLFWDSTLSVHRNCLNCFVFCCYFFCLVPGTRVCLSTIRHFLRNHFQASLEAAKHKAA